MLGISYSIADTFCWLEIRSDSLYAYCLGFDAPDAHCEEKKMVRELYGVLDEEGKSTRWFVIVLLFCITWNVYFAGEDVHERVECDGYDEEQYHN